jgi:hypothetical protein
MARWVRVVLLREACIHGVAARMDVGADGRGHCMVTVMAGLVRVDAWSDGSDRCV